MIAKHLIFIFACTTNVESLRLFVEKDVPQTRKPSMSGGHVFFLNMRKHSDRCHCMASQLSDSPFPVTRIEAATPDNMNDLCPQIAQTALVQNQFNNSALIKSAGRRRKGVSINDPRTPGLYATYCTNYLAWNHFYENSEAEYALIFEDDIILGEGFWERVQNFLASSCDADWDYVNVDGHATSVSRKLYGKFGQKATCRTSSGQKETLGVLNVRLTHFQIIRRSAIPLMLKHAHTHGFSCTEWYQDAFPSDSIKMSHWAPGVCGQAAWSFPEKAHGEGCRDFESTRFEKSTTKSELCPV